jgi:hypothetical protein
MILLIILYLGTLEMIMKALGTSKEQEESKEGDQEQGSLKTSPRPQTDSDFSDPLILGNLTRYAFQWNRFQLNWTLESTGIHGTSWHTELSQGAASPIWAIGPCIVLESIRDMSKGPWPTLGLIKQ